MVKQRVRLLLNVRVHLVFPHEGVSVEVDRVHPLEASCTFTERTFLAVVSSREALVVGRMYGPVAAPSVLGSVKFQEAIVE